MARPFWAQFFTPATERQGQMPLDRRRRALARRAALTGPLSLTDEFLRLKAGAGSWRAERRLRRRAVREDYQRSRVRLLHERHRAQQELERELERQGEEIARYYRLHSLPAEDPRRPDFEERARKQFEYVERVLRRDHHQTWQEQLHQLQSQRDQQYRQLTREMKREHRRAVGLPEELAGLPIQLPGMLRRRGGGQAAGAENSWRRAA